MASRLGTLSPSDVDVHYQDILGRGSFGIVFSGIFKKSSGERRKVSVKQYNVPMSSTKYKGLAEQLTVIQTLAEVNHNLIQFEGFYVKAGMLHVVQEFCNQGDLEQFLKKNYVELDKGIKVMYQCASALEFLHNQSKPIAHKNLKPTNILLHRLPDKLRVKLTDFGCIFDNADLGPTLGLQQTVFAQAFKSPEDFGPQPAGPPGDVFSLGVVFLAIINFKIFDERLVVFSEPALKEGRLLPLGQHAFESLGSGREVPPATVPSVLDVGKLRELKNIINRMTVPEEDKRITMSEVCSEMREACEVGTDSPDLAESGATARVTEDTEKEVDEREKETKKKETDSEKELDEGALAAALASAEGGAFHQFHTEMMRHLAKNMKISMSNGNSSDDDDDDESEEEGDGRKNLRIGQKVILCEDLNRVKSEQEGHGGWVPNMERFLGKTGHIKKWKPRQVQVVFRDGNSLWINPSVLEVFSPENAAHSRTNSDWQNYKFKRLDVVKFKGGLSVEALKNLQENHGGWNARMTKSMKVRGVVHIVDDTGDPLVEFLTGDKWKVNCAALELLTMTCNEELVKDDQVLVMLDRDKVKALQKEHATWRTAMEKCLGESGVVRKVISPEQVEVKVRGKKYVWYRKCLQSIAPKEELVSSGN